MYFWLFIPLFLRLPFGLLRLASGLLRLLRLPLAGFEPAISFKDGFWIHCVYRFTIRALCFLGLYFSLLVVYLPDIYLPDVFIFQIFIFQIPVVNMISLNFNKSNDLCTCFTYIRFHLYTVSLIQPFKLKQNKGLYNKFIIKLTMLYFIV